MADEPVSDLSSVYPFLRRFLIVVWSLSLPSAGFLPFHHDQFMMQPVIGQRFPGDCPAEGDGVFVVREHEVDPPVWMSWCHREIL